MRGETGDLCGNRVAVNAVGQGREQLREGSVRARDPASAQSFFSLLLP